ncbi:DUF2946 family protein [Rhodobacter ferrooxidans]|uniref:MFS transporter n=1 Tax=Rhodobacter ferrooxidans TaxID=371731 RepID=C8S431_9RHOB|nr:DUF2946 family protein [Rhodobacter sp. SW2]EEW24293.1 conserved hypothetical protein [Rhodobacter sp. SW2]
MAFAKTAMVLLVVTSLLTLGFSHRPAVSSADLAKAEYLGSMGLAASDLCAEPGEKGGGMSMGDCPACHLVSSVMLPEPVASPVDIELRYAAVVLVPAQARVFGRTTNPATPVRAPPLA